MPAPAPRPIPVRPVYPPTPAGQHLRRACWAAVQASAAGDYDEHNPVAVARRLWPDDEICPLVLHRAAISGATTTTSGWASQLVTAQVGDWLGSLVPASAAAALIARGTTLPVTDGVPVNIPIRATVPAVAGWVAETGAIAVRQWSFTTTALNPKKLGVIVTMSRELARYSGAEAIFESELRTEAALSLDAAYFSTDDGSVAGRHPGLLSGVTPITPMTGGGTAAMMSDLTRLAAAVSAYGSGQVWFVSGPGRAASTAMRTNEITVGTMLASPAVPETRVIAIDPVSLVHGFGPAPEILASEEPVLHMSDVPLQIATGAQGSGVLATPTQSMFQTAMLAMRMLLDIGFAKRRADCVAYIDNAAWTPA